MRDPSTTGEPEARHGGNLVASARRLGCRPEQLLDASASLVPFGPPAPVRLLLRQALGARAGRPSPLRDYPDRSYQRLREAIAAAHGLDPAAVLPGNGAAELFTWAARDAAATGTSWLPTPGFADYPRALACWGGSWQSLPLPLGARSRPQGKGAGAVTVTVTMRSGSPIPTTPRASSGVAAAWSPCWSVLPW